jgi:hypothetical protein
MAYAFASDLSYFVLEQRRQRGEMSLSGEDCTAQRLYAVPSFIVHRRRFIADVDEIGDRAYPNAPVRLDVPVKG